MEDAQEKQRLHEIVEDNLNWFRDQEENGSYREAFKILDLSGGGTIEADELRVCLRSTGKDPSGTELAAIMKTASAGESTSLRVL